MNALSILGFCSIPASIKRKPDSLTGSRKKIPRKRQQLACQHSRVPRQTVREEGCCAPKGCDLHAAKRLRSSLLPVPCRISLDMFQR